MARPLRHLALNAVFLEPQMGGMVTYVRRLVPELIRQRPDLRITLFASKRGRSAFEDEPWSGDLDLVGHPFLGRRFVSAASEMSLLPALVARRRADLLHSLSMTGPLRGAPSHVVTVPDLIWMNYPSSGRATVAIWKAVVPPIARHAKRIVTLSNASRRDIVAVLGVPTERIDVIPLAADEEPPDDALSEAAARRRFELDARPVVLSVSSKKPHKNLMPLVGAMRKVTASRSDALLVIPGAPAPHDDELRREASAAGVDLRLPGWVSAAELEGLHAAANCAAFPSLREGFGLPVLEAMRRGVPVACSNISSLPEVGGGAVRYFDPYDPDDIADAILDLLHGGPTVDALVHAARERADRFSWATVAAQHLETYERALADA